MDASEDMIALLEASKRAVRKAARLSVRVQNQMSDVDKITKSDLSPVTVGDFGCQAIVSSVLAHGVGTFRLMGEEDADTLRSAGEALLQNVLLAVQGTESDDGGDRTWSAEELIAAVGAGTHSGSPDDGSYWVLDPIDGTKGFLRRGQYAVGLAYVRQGQVDLAAIACPNLPYPGWWDETGLAPSQSPARGTLFTAVRGQGAFMEPLAITPAQAASTPVRIHVSDEDDTSKAVLCESFEAGHSNHGTSAKVAALLGLDLDDASRPSTCRPPIRIDSMCKYGLLARGDGTVYLRFPRRDYVENAWDHAPGSLLLQEAGGTVTDAFGAPLDFSTGRGLSRNYGVIATNGRMHAKVMEAVKQAME